MRMYTVQLKTYCVNVEMDQKKVLDSENNGILKKSAAMSAKNGMGHSITQQSRSSDSGQRYGHISTSSESDIQDKHPGCRWDGIIRSTKSTHAETRPGLRHSCL